MGIENYKKEKLVSFTTNSISPESTTHTEEQHNPPIPEVEQSYYPETVTFNRKLEADKIREVREVLGLKNDEQNVDTQESLSADVERQKGTLDRQQFYKDNLYITAHEGMSETELIHTLHAIEILQNSTQSFIERSIEFLKIRGQEGVLSMVRPGGLGVYDMANYLLGIKKMYFTAFNPAEKDTLFKDNISELSEKTQLIYEHIPAAEIGLINSLLSEDIEKIAITAAIDTKNKINVFEDHTSDVKINHVETSGNNPALRFEQQKIVSDRELDMDREEKTIIDDDFENIPHFRPTVDSRDYISTDNEDGNSSSFDSGPVTKRKSLLRKLFEFISGKSTPE